MKVFILGIDQLADGENHFRLSYLVGSQEHTVPVRVEFVDFSSKTLKVIRFPHELWVSLQFNSVILERLKDFMLADNI
jgi:hypothetical protein